MKLFNKVKRIFSREKSKEALEMWETLTDDYKGDPEFHPSLRIDILHYSELKTQDEKNRYLFDLMTRRNKAHEQSKI